MKSRRQELILEIVRDVEITSQKELLEELGRRGMTVTQATLSRDMNELSLIKVPVKDGRSRYVVPRLSAEELLKGDRTTFDLLKNSVTGVDHSLTMVVIRCRTGMAQAVCAKLDEAHIENSLGTIAGDDTIFMLMRTLADAERFDLELSAIISG